jgi:hypothetical protein
MPRDGGMRGGRGQGEGWLGVRMRAAAVEVGELEVYACRQDGFYERGLGNGDSLVDVYSLLFGYPTDKSFILMLFGDIAASGSGPTKVA